MFEESWEGDLLPDVFVCDAPEQPPKQKKQKTAKIKPHAAEKQVPSAADGFLVQVSSVVMFRYRSFLWLAEF